MTDPRDFIARLAACGLDGLPKHYACGEHPVPPGFDGWRNGADRFIDDDTATLVAEALATRWLAEHGFTPRIARGVVTITVDGRCKAICGRDTLAMLSLAVEAAFAWLAADAKKEDEDVR